MYNPRFDINELLEATERIALGMSKVSNLMYDTELLSIDSLKRLFDKNYEGKQGYNLLTNAYSDEIKYYMEAAELLNIAHILEWNEDAYSRDGKKMKDNNIVSIIYNAKYENEINPSKIYDLVNTLEDLSKKEGTE